MQNMLQSAHRGYEYQDLLVAIRLVDLVLGVITEIRVDEKAFPSDRFDDLKTTGLEAHRELSQIKHTTLKGLGLSLALFTTEQRGLRLDRLVESALTERSLREAGNTIFRVVLCHTSPPDSQLAHFLQAAQKQTSPFAPGIQSQRYMFNVDELWPKSDASFQVAKQQSPFAFLLTGSGARDDLAWVCERLVLEVDGPHASFDLTSPGAAENLLLERVQRDIGAGSYPNQRRSTVDVAAAFIATARAARMHTVQASVEVLIRNAQLRTDSGAVARAQPVDRNVEIPREEMVASVVDQMERLAAGENSTLLIVGPPGQGKSWGCSQLVELLGEHGWLVAEHYCFLGDANIDRDARVVTEAIVGSLVRRITEADPSASAQLRPLFSADVDALESILRRVRAAKPNRRVALIVDGLDHVTRVLGGSRSRDPSSLVAERLAELRLANGTVLVVLSQPGPHLRPLQEAGAKTFEIPMMQNHEIGALATRLGVLSAFSLDPDALEARELISALSDRSRGNALYATYLCREALRTELRGGDPVATINALPVFDGTLRAYYEHLMKGLEGQADLVGDVLSLLDFSVTRAELKEILPGFAHRVDSALNHLLPVLVERVGQSGIRIYHESFARYAMEAFEGEPSAATSNLERIASWLKCKGFFDDARAYRFLLPVLARAGRAAEVIELVQDNFAELSIAHGFATTSIVANLGVAIECACSLKDWPAVVRAVELARAAPVYEHENLDVVLEDLAFVATKLLGAERFAERLLYDGRTTMHARIGIQVCARIDIEGGAAPWPEYLEAFERESETDNTLYGDESKAVVALARVRGELRAAFSSGATITAAKIVDWLEGVRLSPRGLMDVICDCVGNEVAWQVAEKTKDPGKHFVALSQRFAERGDVHQAKQAAERSLEFNLPRGVAAFLLSLDVPAPQFAEAPDILRDELIRLTRAVQRDDVQWDESEPVAAWVDACTIAVRTNEIALGSAEALIGQTSWYECWMLFVIELCRAEVQPSAARSARALNALRILTRVTDGFKGRLRVVDLYRMREPIRQTLRRALALVDDNAWPQALRTLHEISRETTATFKGESAGPLTPNTLLDLVVSASSSASRLDETDRLLTQMLKDDRSHIYPVLARFELIGSRLALNSGDEPRARQRWQSACRLLVAYGSHKDRTIFEILDPLELRITSDAMWLRERMSKLQPLCERLLDHTDRDETRHAIGRWWDLLALYDPGAQSYLTSQALLRNANLSRDSYEHARSDLWQQQAANVDPILALALRVTVPLTRHPKDVLELARVVGLQSNERSVEALIRAGAARFDEWSTRYSSSESEGADARDKQFVSEMNAILLSGNASPIADTKAQPSPSQTRKAAPRYYGEPDLQSLVDQRFPESFQEGISGLARAVRIWREPLRPDESTSSRDRFGNAIGYRMLELLDRGQQDDVKQALLSVSHRVSFNGEESLLADLAAGLERYGNATLAAFAYALVWTRTRGGGGWNLFGGETAIGALKKSAVLDGSTALEVIGAEVRDTILSSSYGGYGLTRALVFAFSAVDFGPDTLPSNYGSWSSVSTGAWDAAMSVISYRIPASTLAEESYEDSYRPLAQPLLTLESAFALSTLAGIAHPSREQKRRSLLAFELLLRREDPALGEAVAIALEHLVDPACVGWVLGALARVGEAGIPVARRCSSVLERLAVDEHLAVRVSARRLLTQIDVAVKPLPVGDPETTLLSSVIIRTGDSDMTSEANLAEAKSDVVALVEQCAGPRLARAESMLPRLSQGVGARVARYLASSETRERQRRQIDRLMSARGTEWPDAFIVPDETVEAAIQVVAGTGRAALAASGHVVKDPESWERDLAALLSEPDEIAMKVEAVREPRPDIGLSSIDREADSSLRTEALRRPEETPSEKHGPLRGWRTVALIERRAVVSRPMGDTDGVVQTCFGLELRDLPDLKGLGSVPFGSTGPDVWSGRSSGPVPERTSPCFGVAFEARHSGLGIPIDVLGPLPWAVSAFELTSGGSNEHFVLNDRNGPTLTLRVWRASYTDGDYDLTRPLLIGARLLLRSDTFERFAQQFQGRLFLREVTISTTFRRGKS
jgi:hypothetical protein